MRNGTWRVDATYGNVWFPSRVGADWAPYRDGHWSWIDPWGWTWVDDAPWGFAVSHYGRWANLRGTWGWVPGPVRSRAYYAPALVAFVGGANFQLSISSGNVGGVAWFPLAPREVYRPSYAVSRGYFENVNRSNTVINTTVINNYYNNTNVTNVVYANRQVSGAIVAVPVTRIRAVAARVPVGSAGVARNDRQRTRCRSAPVAPTERSVRGAPVRAASRLPARSNARPSPVPRRLRRVPASRRKVASSLPSRASRSTTTPAGRCRLHQPWRPLSSPWWSRRERRRRPVVRRNGRKPRQQPRTSSADGSAGTGPRAGRQPSSTDRQPQAAATSPAQAAGPATEARAAASPSNARSPHKPQCPSNARSPHKPQSPHRRNRNANLPRRSRTTRTRTATRTTSRRGGGKPKT